MGTHANHTGRRSSLMVLCLLGGMVSPAWAINVDVTMEDAGQIMDAAREPMEQVTSNEEMFQIIQEADKKSRIGDDPAVKPCGSSAILRTKTYWLEYFGREEARRSKVAQREIRMPEAKIQEILTMPNLEIEIGLCGQEEFFAEGVDVALQQGARNVMAVDKGKPSRGRNIPGSETDYVSRFSARFAYRDFDPNAETTLVIFFPDGTLINLKTDFAAIR
ncbi:MAG: hypothetical protein OXU40_08625 [Nitrospira sp.]|nr:hypothetical protein [Nitrospira sp.]